MITAGPHASATNGEQLKPSPALSAVINAAANGTNVDLWTPRALHFSSGGTNHNNNNYNSIPSSAPIVSENFAMGAAGAHNYRSSPFRYPSASSAAASNVAPAPISPMPGSSTHAPATDPPSSFTTNHFGALNPVPGSSTHAPATANHFGAHSGGHQLALVGPQFTGSPFAVQRVTHHPMTWKAWNERAGTVVTNHIIQSEI